MPDPVLRNVAQRQCHSPVFTGSDVEPSLIIQVVCFRAKDGIAGIHRILPLNPDHLIHDFFVALEPRLLLLSAYRTKEYLPQS